VAVCVVLVASWISHWWEQREQRTQELALEVLSREHQPTRAMLKQLIEMRQRLQDLQQEELVAQELQHQRNPLAVLGVISKTAQTTGGRLRVTRLELTDFQRAAATPEPSANAGAESPGVRVTGVSLDNPAVADLLDGLQHAGLFGQVELVSMKRREEAASAVRDYEVRCDF
jgi:Tfp pilus assembly protein PilN